MGKVRLPSVKLPLPSPKSTTRPGGAERNQSTLPSPLKSNSTCERDVLVPRVTLVGVKFTWPGVEIDLAVPVDVEHLVDLGGREAAGGDAGEVPVAVVQCRDRVAAAVAVEE